MNSLPADMEAAVGANAFMLFDVIPVACWCRQGGEAREDGQAEADDEDRGGQILKKRASAGYAALARMISHIDHNEAHAADFCQHGDLLLWVSSIM